MTYSKADEVPHSLNGVLRANNIDLVTKTLDLTDIRYIADTVKVPPTKKVRRGSLLICTASGSRSHLGKVALIDDDYDLAFGGFMGLITAKPGVDERFLFYLMTSETYQEKLDSLAGGTNINNLKFKDVADFPVPLPPLEEQRRIVAVLDQAFAGIATATIHADKNLANARELLHAATESRMKGQGDGWVEKSLGSFCDIYQPETISKKQMSDDGPYVVFGANGKIGRYTRFNHEQPQLLVTCRGATCGAINMSEPFCWITGNAMVVRPKDGELRLGFLRRIFETGFDFSKVVTGAAQPQITRQSLAPSKVAFPVDLEEQECLELELDEIEVQVRELEGLYEASIMELAELKRSLLHRAFSGELTEREPLAA